MKNKYETFSREQLIEKILKLEKERYGLVWEDKEEEVAKRCDSELPLLKEDWQMQQYCCLERSHKNISLHLKLNVCNSMEMWWKSQCLHIRYTEAMCLNLLTKPRVL